MSFLGDLRERIPDFNLRERIPSGDRLYSLLAFVVIIATVVGYAFFAISSIVPQWKIRQTLLSQLAAVEQQLMEARKGQETTPQDLEAQLAEAQAALDEAVSIFLSEAEAAGVLNSLYQYADESGVEIISLQEQAEPTGAGAGEGEGEGEEEAENANANKGIYDVRMFQLQVEGSTRNLITFVSQIEEAAYEGFVVTSVNIVEGAGRHVLTMDISLYTSPYSSGAAGQVTPVATPAPADLAQLEESLAAAWASGDWEQAIVLINQILAIDPGYDDLQGNLYTAYVNYGYSLLEAGNNDAAIMQFNLALGIKPSGEEALAGLEQATVMPTPTLTVEQQLEQRLDAEWTAGNWAEAISLIEQILALNPDDEMTEKLYVAHVNYGYALAAEGRLEEAKEEFSRALEIKPDGAEAAVGLQQLAGETPPSPPPSESQYTIHVVQRGENLYRISLRYGTTVEAIMAANGLTSNNIYVGQQLRIPLP